MGETSAHLAIISLSRATFLLRLRWLCEPASIDCMSQTFHEPDFLRKICEARDIAHRMRQLPHPVVFTNGVFDVLHRGHVTYLAQARALGGSLVVGLNTDASARRLGKGPERPLNAQLDRAAMLAALECVSLVTWFDEDTPLELIREVHPDILVKGGDYDMQTLVETKLVQSWGGTALAIPFLNGYSTTALVQRIRSNS
jgi:rfaE bifunctional protein nucleotidyltransferase chain/domain